MSRTPDIEAKDGMWYWYHNISECYYHTQITVKYRKSLLNEPVQTLMLQTMFGFKERLLGMMRKGIPDAASDTGDGTLELQNHATKTGLKWYLDNQIVFRLSA